MGIRNAPMVTLVAVIVLLSSSKGIAQDNADVVKYRKSVMSTMAGHISAASAIARGLVPHQEHLAAHKSSLGASADMIDELFPEGSGADDSAALAVIWEDADGFAAALAAYQEAARVFAASADDRASTLRAMSELGSSCSGCHDNYRRASE